MVAGDQLVGKGLDTVDHHADPLHVVQQLAHLAPAQLISIQLLHLLMALNSEPIYDLIDIVVHVGLLENPSRQLRLLALPSPMITSQAARNNRNRTHPLIYPGIKRLTCSLVDGDSP